MRSGFWFALMCVVTAGCKPKPDVPLPVDAAPQKKPAAELFKGTRPGPVGEAAKVRVGMSAAEAKKAAPSLFVKKTSEHSYLADDDRYDGVQYSVMVGDEIVNQVAIYLQGDAYGMLTAAWGPPAVEASAAYWFNVETGTRSQFDTGYGRSILFEPYTPLAKVLGEDPGTTFAFEKDRPLLGAKKSAALPEPKLPPTEWATTAKRAHVELDIENDVVAGYKLFIPTGLVKDDSDPRRAGVLATLTKKLGKPEQGEKGMLVFSKAKPRITAKADRDGWMLTVER
jgi:hypothetical protein